MKKFSAQVGFERAISDLEDRHAKHPAITDGKMKARSQSSQLDLPDTMHRYMDNVMTLAERDCIKLMR